MKDKNRNDIINALKQTIESDACKFVEGKDCSEKTMVINIETGEFYGYLLPPMNALKAAHVAQVLRKVGNVRDIEFVMMFSASEEFEQLDDQIEFAADNNLLRLGDLYTHFNELGRASIESVVDAKRATSRKVTGR